MTHPTHSRPSARTFARTGILVRAAALTVLALLVAALVAVPASAASGVVNVNTADEDQLALLPRVGPSIAGRIAEHREANGEFAGAEELMLVRGIGEKTFELLEPWIVIEGDTTLTEKVRTTEARERLEQGKDENR
jgi:competence protein ComEA